MVSEADDQALYFTVKPVRYNPKVCKCSWAEPVDPGDIWMLTMRMAGDSIYQDREQGHPAQPTGL